MLEPIQNTFFLGHSKIEKELFEDYQNKTLPHSMIFYGEKGIGKETFAIRFARFILSKNKQVSTDFSVEKNDKIIKQIIENNCLNFHKISKNPEKTSEIIDVEQIRNLIKKLRVKIEKDENRIILINPANIMNRNATNALLKLLEEPPENTIFILIADTLDNILPTIKSRCRLIRFSRLSNDEVQKIADFSNTKITEKELKKSKGSVGKLKKILEEKKLIESFEKLLKTPTEINSLLKKKLSKNDMEFLYNEVIDVLQNKNDFDKIKELNELWKNYKMHDLDQKTTLLLMLDL
ncbi:MAG: hypothetical protein ACTSXL_02885 [Alphaproteobacteria bacterium]|nr:MAG: hypothetical protein B6I23_02180 [Rickettsiaceae bacterium 4572_127]